MVRRESRMEDLTGSVLLMFSNGLGLVRKVTVPLLLQMFKHGEHY